MLWISFSVTLAAFVRTVAFSFASVTALVWHYILPLAELFIIEADHRNHLIALQFQVYHKIKHLVIHFLCGSAFHNNRKIHVGRIRLGPTCYKPI